MSFRRGAAPSILVAAFLLAACAATPSAPVSCATAFATAVGIGTGDEGVAFYALRPVFAACATADEWTTEWTRHHGLGYVGTPAEVLGQMCQVPELKDSRLCIAARPTP